MSRGASRSMREARTAWTVSGSAISSTGAAGAYAPRSPRSAPRSTSERTISSTKRGLPRARASMRARSGASAGSGPSQSSSRVEASAGARGESERCSTRAAHAGRYSGRAVASSRTRLPADSGARRRPASISSAASLAGSSQCRSSIQSTMGSRRARAWIRSQSDWNRRARRASGSSSDGASAGSGAPRSSSQKARAIGSTVGALAEAAPHGISDVRSRGALVDAEETARELDDRVEGEHAPVGERAGLVERHAAGALDELVTQAALSRARLPGDQDDLRSAGPRLVAGPARAARAHARGRRSARSRARASARAGSGSDPGRADRTPARERSRP